jgi:hypothetical protein
MLAIAVIASMLTVAAVPAAGPAVAPAWRTLGPGVDYAAIAISPRPAIGDGRLHVVRVDPARATLRTRLVAEVGGEARTARQWANGPRIAAVINAGMYATDFRTHVGYLRVGERVHTRNWASKYQSVLLLGARRPGLPAATIRDTQPGDTAAAFAHYDTVIQNLRLIRDPGVSVWSKNGRRWSEAAIALDREGRILLLFCRSPFTMYDFNAMLGRLKLGVVRAMHVEGGPEASLSVRGPGIELDLAGSYETGFEESDGNDRQWALPNVVVVELKPQ